MRPSFALFAALALSLALALPALAARPTIVSFADDDVADGNFFTGLCGFTVTAESAGHVVYHNDKRGANTLMANWNINTWLHSAHGSYHLVDAGPDMEHRRAGTTSFTVTGRSVTFSTVIGRTEVNLDTGEVVFHGNLVGTDVFDPEFHVPICDALD